MSESRVKERSLKVVRPLPQIPVSVQRDHSVATHNLFPTDTVSSGAGSSEHTQVSKSIFEPPPCLPALTIDQNSFFEIKVENRRDSPLDSGEHMRYVHFPFMINSAARSLRSVSFFQSVGITQKPWMDFLFMMREEAPGLIVFDEFGRHAQTLNALISNILTFTDTRYCYWTDNPFSDSKGNPQNLSAKQMLELDYTALMHPGLSAKCSIALTFWWWSVLDTHRAAKVPTRLTMRDTTINFRTMIGEKSIIWKNVQEQAVNFAFKLPLKILSFVRSALTTVICGKVTGAEDGSDVLIRLESLTDEQKCKLYDLLQNFLGFENVEQCLPTTPRPWPPFLHGCETDIKTHFLGEFLVAIFSEYCYTGDNPLSAKWGRVKKWFEQFNMAYKSWNTTVPMAIYIHFIVSIMMVLEEIRIFVISSNYVFTHYDHHFYIVFKQVVDHLHLKKPPLDSTDASYMSYLTNYLNVHISQVLWPGVQISP